MSGGNHYGGFTHGGTYGAGGYIPASQPAVQTGGTGYFQQATNPSNAQTTFTNYSAVNQQSSNNTQAHRGGAHVNNTSSATTGNTAGGTGSTYTGYDAAVYAAATNYLQTRSTGQTNQYGATRGNSSNYRGGRGRGRDNFNNRSSGTNNSMSQMHYCETCKISCAGPQTYREHLAGSKHKKRENQIKEGADTQSMSKTKNTFRCELCSVSMTGEDAYNAHIKGAKHQKAMKLQQTMGKPMPSNEPTVYMPEGGAVKKVVGLQPTQFVGGSTLNSTTKGGPSFVSGGQPGIGPQLLQSTAEIVGEDYIEVSSGPNGRPVYHCKLCECGFNDVMARDLHLKGRRHRQSYKKKVDPSIEVEPGKGSKGPPPQRQNEEKLRKELMRMRQQELWSMRAMYSTQNMTSLAGANTGPPQPLFGQVQKIARNAQLDDRHVMLKHQNIYPVEDELSAIQSLVINAEKALKAVSDSFAEADNPKEPEKKEEDETEADRKKRQARQEKEGDRLLKGVMRVGLLGKGLLLKGDKKVQLVVLCTDKPTRSLLHRVAVALPEHIKKVASDVQYGVSESSKDGCITVSTKTEPIFTATLHFTSVVLRSDQPSATLPMGGTSDPVDMLHVGKCLAALAELRHAKWFQALELLVEKVLTSAAVPSTPGESVRRVFEAVASGVLLGNGPGLLDPCERDVVDALDKMSAQEREDITSSAQLHKILSVDRITDENAKRQLAAAADRKRPRQTDSADKTGTNKGKKDKPEVEKAKQPEPMDTDTNTNKDTATPAPATESAVSASASAAVVEVTPAVVPVTKA